MLVVGVRRLQKKGSGVCLDVPAIWLRNAKLSSKDQVSVSIDDECNLVITAHTAQHPCRR